MRNVSEDNAATILGARLLIYYLRVYTVLICEYKTAAREATRPVACGESERRVLALR